MQLVRVVMNTLLVLVQLVSFLSHFPTIRGTATLTGLEPNVKGNSTYSPWLTHKRDPRAIGCQRRPWICNDGSFPPRIRRLCCRNRCVDVTSDVNNCGFCESRCPFNWQCCRGMCIDININPSHCGGCEHQCRFPSLCLYGMCGYAQPLPPFPFPPGSPFPPRPHPPRPRPHKPFPSRPWPPKPYPPRSWPKPPRGHHPPPGPPPIMAG